MQRVLEIVADGSLGGGTTHVLQILRAFRSTYSLGLVTQANSFLLSEARSLGIECFGVDFFSSRLNARVPLTLRRFVRGFKPQLVHAHGARAGFFWALAETRVPTVYTVHGYYFCHKPSLLVRWLARHAERLASYRADRVIFVCNHDAQAAERWSLLRNPSLSDVIYNGIPLEKIPIAKPTNPKRIGFIGRLVPDKNPLLFLDVMEQLPNYSAIIVGDGVLGERVRAEINGRNLSRVSMLGSLPPAKSLEELSSLQTVVMTSRWEGLPILPLEAMQAGVPIVATKVGGLNEIIEDERSGLLVDSRSATDLAHAVMRISEDNTLRRRIIDNARTRVADLFSEERMLSSIDAIYREMALP